jgi:ABC-type transport system involved in multi-copper enzyme maturation permease subunit
MMIANSELQRVGLSGWRSGLANLLRKENRAWWASRRWLVQSVLWTVVVNGFAALFALGLPLLVKMAGNPAVSIGDPLSIGVELLFKLGALALGIGAVVLVADAIISERQLGVTEWLLSKPVSRSSYVLSKLLAHGLGVLVVLVGLQSALGYGLLSLIIGEPFPLPGYLVGVCGLAVHTLFYLALTLMMGVLTTSRGTLLGVSLGALLGGTVFGGFLGMFALLTPWALANVLPAAVLGIPLPLPVWLPIGMTAMLSVLCVAVTLARFERLEF